MYPLNKLLIFSKLICDYLDEKENLKFLYNRFPRLEGFKDQILEKQSAYPEANRKVLQQSLKGQYSRVDTSKLTQNNIDALAVIAATLSGLLQDKQIVFPESDL